MKNDKTIDVPQTFGGFLGFTLSLFTIVPLVYYWYNHVWFQYPVMYWQYVVLAFVCVSMGYILEKLVGYLFGILFIASLICQVMSWIGIIVLPVFHISH